MQAQSTPALDSRPINYMGDRKKKPKISVVVAVYNAVDTVERCINSYSTQTYPEKELIIMDGGSKDGTVEVLKRLGSSITYWDSAPDKGIADAWNKGIAKTTGDWIYFMGADDYLWSPSCFEYFVKWLGENPTNSSIIYGSVNLVDEQENIIMARSGPQWSFWSKLHFYNQSIIPHQSVFQKRSLFDEYGYFDGSFRIASDYDLMLRVLKHEAPCYIKDFTVAGQQTNGLSSTGRNELVILNEFRKAQEKNGLEKYGSIIFYLQFAAIIKEFFYQKLGDPLTLKLINFYRLLTFRAIRNIPPSSK